MFIKRRAFLFMYMQGAGKVGQYKSTCSIFFLHLVFVGVIFGGGEDVRTVLTVAEGSITGALVGIHKVCCPGWCTLISLAWTSIL